MKGKVLKALTLIVAALSLLPLFSFNSSAENQQYCKQIGFEVDKDVFVSFQYNLERKYYEYYDSKIVGKTTIDSITSHSKEYSLGEKINLACIRILTEPRTITVQERFLCFKWDSEKKFGISKLKVYRNYSGDDQVSLHYATTADTATSTYTYGGSFYGTASYSSFGARIDYSVTSTMTKGICDCSNYSTSSKTDLNFIFGTPKTNEQKKRVYEQTYFYIEEATLGEPDFYKMTGFTITPTYACGSLTGCSSHWQSAHFTPINNIADGSLR